MNTYMPILKGKMGEYGALAELKAATKERVLPLIEIPPVPYDYSQDQPSKTVSAHIAPVAEQLANCWGKGQRVLLDTGWVDEEDSYSCLLEVSKRCHEEGLQVVPTLAVSKPAGDDLNGLPTTEGACIRVGANRLNDESLDQDIANMLEALGIERGQIDLALDLGELQEEQTGIYVMAVMGILSCIDAIDQFRSLTIISAAFPENLSNVTKDSIERMPRLDWQLWKTIGRRGKSLPVMPSFGDYGICHPRILDIDPRIMSPSASIRYTTETDWLILKGRTVRRRNGYQQFPKLCQDLVAMAEFSGKEFSSGDRYIADCAAGADGPGNLTTWRKVGTNHHIEMVVRQLASLDES